MSSVDQVFHTDDIEPAISVTDLVAHYGTTQILHGITLDINPGEIVVIMGGSGSGKSTFLRHLMGLERRTLGSVNVLGVDLEKANAAETFAVRQKMGVAFQGGALFSSMTVGQNVMMPMTELTKLNKQTKQIMMRMKLEVVELAGFENLMPSQLSGGMIKRAALARAIALDPKILFCDEPSAGLDPVVSRQIDDLILKLRDAMGMTIVVVTHELESAFRIADRIAMLDRGHLLAHGTVNEIRNHPSSRIQNLLNRRLEDTEIDPDAYLKRLTEGA